MPQVLQQNKLIDMACRMSEGGEMLQSTDQM